jgi:molecular chaperone GrpE
MSEEKQNNENVENEVVQKEQVSELDSKKQELEELTDRYKRVMAEFENYKKRAQKDKETLYGRTLSDVIEIILPVLDNLENAAKAETQDTSYKQGVEMVLKQFKEVLATRGVEEIKAVGETFDPSLHEAVSSVDDPSVESQKIVQEYRKGYRFGSKVIRHSMVVVNN